MFVCLFAIFACALAKPAVVASPFAYSAYSAYSPYAATYTAPVAAASYGAYPYAAGYSAYPYATAYVR